MTQPQPAADPSLQSLSADPDILALQQQLQQVEAEQQSDLAALQGEVPTQAQFDALQAKVANALLAAQQQMQQQRQSIAGESSGAP